METNPGHRDDSNEERTALDLANQVRQRLTRGLRLPAGFYQVLAVAVTLQLGAAAYGIAAQTAVGLAVLMAGLAVFLGAAALMLYRFHLINGVRVDGLTSQIVFSAGAAASLIYLGALAVGIWAAFASLWWMVAVAAVFGGVGCALGARRWWHAYQDDPAAHAAGVSPRQLGVLALLASLGFAALVVLG